MCDKGFIRNTSNCECECDKSCDVGEYLNNKNFKCRNRLIDKLVEECSENIDGNKMLYNETLDIVPLDAIPLNVYKKSVWFLYTIHCIFVVFFIYALGMFLFVFIGI